MTLPSIRAHLKESWLMENRRHRYGQMHAKHPTNPDLFGFTETNEVNRYCDFPFDAEPSEKQKAVTERYSIMHHIFPTPGVYFPEVGQHETSDGVHIAVVSELHAQGNKPSGRVVNIGGCDFVAVRNKYLEIRGGSKTRVSWSAPVPKKTRFYVEHQDGPQFVHELPFSLEPLPMSQIHLPDYKHPFVVQVEGRSYVFDEEGGYVIKILVRPIKRLDE